MVNRSLKGWRPGESKEDYVTQKRVSISCGVDTYPF